MRLSSFILDNLEVLLKEWEDFSATLVLASQQVDKATLRDHGKHMLSLLSIWMAGLHMSTKLIELFKLPPDKITGKNYRDLVLPNASELQGQIDQVIKSPLPNI